MALEYWISNPWALIPVSRSGYSHCVRLWYDESI